MPIFDPTQTLQWNIARQIEDRLRRQMSLGELVATHSAMSTTIGTLIGGDENMRRAIDMHAIYERASIRKHGSYMPHGAIFKLTRDILKVGDVWRFCLSSLELQNAETKRVAKSGG